MNKIKKKLDVVPRPSAESLFSIDDFDRFFDDLITRKWYRQLDWNMPATYAKDLYDIGSEANKKCQETSATHAMDKAKNTDG